MGGMVVCLVPVPVVPGRSIIQKMARVVVNVQPRAACMVLIVLNGATVQRCKTKSKRQASKTSNYFKIKASKTGPEKYNSE